MEESVTVELGTRSKRWVNMNKSTCLPSGKLRPEIRQRKSAQGWGEADIDAWEAVFTSEFEELKRLDETDPEPWVNYTAYDFFTEAEKKIFLPTGEIKPEVWQKARENGDNMNAYWNRERIKMDEVVRYNSISARRAEYGENYGQSLMDSRRSAARRYASNLRQQEQDLRNFEDISELPLDIDPDKYYG